MNPGQSHNVENQPARIIRFPIHMLSFAKPEELKFEETDLGVLLHQILRMLENSAKRSGIEIFLDIRTGNTAIYADKNLIKQALINVLMNQGTGPFLPGYLR